MMTREEMRENLQEPEVEGLAIAWEKPGQEVYFRFSHSQEESGKFGDNVAYYGTEMDTGTPIKFWATMGLTQAFEDHQAVSGDVCLLKFLEEVGQFKRFALSVVHTTEGEGEPF